MAAEYLLLALLMTLVGAAIGVFGGLCGIGGGLLSIPVLGIFFGASEQVAQGSSLVMVTANLLSGVASYRKNNSLLWYEGIVVGLTAIPMTVLFAHFAIHMTSEPLRKAFAVFLIALGVWTMYAWMRRTMKPDADAPPAFRRLSDSQRTLFLIGLGVASGCLGGMFGIGGGIFTAAVLANICGYRQVEAQGVCLISAIPTCSINIYNYNHAHDINWTIGLALTVGGLFTVPFGARLAVRSREIVLKNLFAAICFVCAAGLWVRG